MIFNSEIALDKKRAIERFRFFLEKGKTFELVEKKQKRSIRQNSYLHLIISWYALEYGETASYIKQEVFKKQINKDIFEYEYINKKTGEIRIEYKSTSIIDKGQMTTAINRFRNYASKEAGIYLPEPTDIALLQQIENEIKNNQYL
jgi:hypothetical protein